MSSSPNRPAPKPLICLIAARAANGIIGVDGQLPWRLPEDLAWFKRHTLNKPVIMGRKTYESIGRPLPRRRNIVISRSWQEPIQGIEIFASLQEALSTCGSVEEIMIIGGGQIYAQALPLAGRIILTDIHNDIAGDARFPDINQADWQEIFSEDHPLADPAFTFRILNRKAAVTS